VALLWTVQNGYMDDITAERIREFQVKLGDFLTTRKAELLARIAREQALTDDLTATLKTAVTEFKNSWS
jgi:F-type H+/Na+-transporting ATPase subunit alpha